MDLSFDGCLEIYQLLEFLIICGLSNQVIGQLLAVFVLLKIIQYFVPFSCLLLC